MKQRDLYADSLKGLLITFVVIIHFTETCASPINIATDNFLFLLTMPLFCFTSGYFGFSKDRKSLVQKTLTLLETYLVFQIFYYRPHNIEGFKNVFTLHYTHLWYVSSLIMWRIILYFIPKNYIKHAIVASFAIGIACGFCEYIDSTFSLSQILVFLPYFLLGSYVKQNYSSIHSVTQYVNKTTSLLIIIVVLGGVIAYNSFLGYIVFGSLPYSQIVDSPIQPAAMRTLLYVIALPLGLSVMKLLTANKLLASLGRSTMTIYLWHWLFRMIYQVIDITAPILDWILAFATIVILFYFDKLKITHFINNPISNLIKKYKRNAKV